MPSRAERERTQQRRALRLLADAPEGMTEALMMAHGFNSEPVRPPAIMRSTLAIARPAMHRSTSSLARGVPANVVILSREGLSELIAAKRIVAGTDVDLARVPLGVAVRAGTPKPDVSTVEAFKQALLRTKTVAMASTSGVWLKNDLFPRLGIAEKINAKVTPRGADAAEMVAAGAADLAVMPISEIVHAGGVDLAGNLAPEVQFVQTFSAGIVAGSEDIQASKRLIEFLASPRAFETIGKSGMEPVAAAR